jgi:hypothetical protein
MNPSLPLTEPQERHITTILAHLEKAVSDLRNSIGASPPKLALTRYEDALPATLDKAVAPLICKLEASLARITRELELPSTRSSILRRHLVNLQLLSIDVGTLLPSSGLRGYGEVAPATAQYLEEQIPGLEAMLRELVRLLGGGG